MRALLSAALFAAAASASAAVSGRVVTPEGQPVAAAKVTAYALETASARAERLALVRAGVERLVLIDHDVVEQANLSRTVYEAADCGRPKTEALAARLQRINPNLTVARHQAEVGGVDPQVLRAALVGVDLVVAATDDPSAQRMLDAHAHWSQVPAVFPGLYAGAQGGEVVVSVPGRTACFRCATSIRHRADEADGERRQRLDYGTNRLAAEVGLAADIQHVTSAAVKLALAALTLGRDCTTSAFLDRALEQGTSYLTMSMVPDYWFYPDIFADTPGQYAYQSVWLAPTCDPACPVCGEIDLRVDPAALAATRPPAAAVVAALAEVLRSDQRHAGGADDEAPTADHVAGDVTT